MKGVIIGLGASIVFALIGGIKLLIDVWNGKNQIITDKTEQIEELKEIRTGLNLVIKDLQVELHEERLRTAAITELYDEKCEQYDSLYTITVTNIFKPKDKQFLTMDVMRKAVEQSLKVVNG